MNALYAAGVTPCFAATSSKLFPTFNGLPIAICTPIAFLAMLLFLPIHSVRAFNASCSLVLAACCLAVIRSFSTYPSKAFALLFINLPSFVKEAWYPGTIFWISSKAYFRS